MSTSRRRPAVRHDRFVFGTDLGNYNVYRVIKPIEVRMGPAAPAFDMPGYGTQYQLPRPVSELIDPGYYLERVIKKQA